MVSPCRGCDRRHERCHSDCKEYKDFRAEVDRRNNARRKALDLEYALDNAEIRRAVKWGKK